MDRLTLMETFVQVAECGSFSGAAEALRSTQPSVSKLIRMLEAELKVTLFNRTTRRITLTHEAERLLPHARALIERYAEAAEAACGERAEPRGHLRVLTSDGLGRALFLPYLGRFLERHPRVTVEHLVTDRKIDLVENHIDLALRMGELKDSSYAARRIGLTRRATVASPAYLRERGPPQSPADLAQHNCIVFTRLHEYTGATGAWEYCDPETGAVIPVAVSGNYASDNSSMVRQAALDGIGIYQGPNWLFGEDVAEGRLVEVLGRYRMEPFPIYLIRPAADYVPVRVRAMMEFLAHEYSINPWVAV